MAISAHGTQVLRNGVALPEVRDIIGPALLRKAFDVTKLRQLDDEYKVGLRNIGEVQFEVNALPDTLTEPLIAAWTSGVIDDYAIVFPDTSMWSFTGCVVNLGFKVPVEGVLLLVVVLQPSGGITFGTFVTTSFILTEASGHLDQEDGSHLILDI